METRFFSISRHARDDFETEIPSTVVLLGCRVVLMADSLADAEDLLAGAKDEILGVVLTLADELTCNPCGRRLWHLTVTPDMLPKIRSHIDFLWSLVDPDPGFDGLLPLTLDNVTKVLNSTPLLMSISTVEEGRILEVNDAFCRDMGFRRREVIGRTSAELGLFDDSATRQAFVAELREHGVVTRLEVRAKNKQRREQVFLLNGTLLDLDGLKCLVLWSENVTELRRNEADFVAAKQMLEAAVGQSSAGIIIADAPDVTIRHCNPAAFAIRGGDKSRLTGIDLAEHSANWQVFRPDGSMYPPAELPLSRAVLRGEVVRAQEVVIRDEAGLDHWVAVNAAPIRDDAGAITGGIAVMQEITEQKQATTLLQESEAKIRSVFRAAPIGIGVVSGRVLIQVNERLCEMMGYTADELLGESSRLLYPSDEEFAWVGDEKYRQISAQGTDTVDTRWLCKDGRIIDVLLSSTPLDPENLEKGVTFTALDITARREAEEENKRLEAQYYQAQKVESIGRLAGGVAHDLNNLLFPILGYSDLLMEDGGLNEEQLDGVQQIHEAGIRSRNLVRQLLAFSRKQALEYKALDLNATLKDFESLLRRTVREDVVIGIRTRDGLPLVMADAGQIEQVLMNLVVNAQDAMPDGGELSLETDLVQLDEDYLADQPGAEPGPYAALIVSDTGCGMGEETRQHIFEPFFSTKGELGTGLGLATVYGIVKQHGGNIWVYSEPGSGTTFKVYLPASPATQADPGEQRSGPTTLKGSETVLVVEDNQIVRELACSILQRNDYKVLSAESGAEACELMSDAQEPVHLLLTDVVMPETNGKEVYQQLVERIPGLRVLYMSGYTDDVIADRGVLQEGVSFIQKPFTVQALCAKVREVLD
ncbi:MAG: PAS domain S-box protein [bacterium]|nr:PAS domain S-box protein [bacterium]